MLLYGEIIKDVLVLVFVLVVGAIVVSGGISFLAGTEARASFAKFTRVLQGACDNGYAADTGFKIPYGYMIIQTHPEIDTLKENYEQLPTMQSFWIWSVDKSEQLAQEKQKFEGEIQKCNANVAAGTGGIIGDNCVCLASVNTNTFMDVLNWIMSLGQSTPPSDNNFIYFFGGEQPIFDQNTKAIDMVGTKDYAFTPEKNVFGIGSMTYLVVNNVNGETISYDIEGVYGTAYTALEEFSRATFLASAYSIAGASWPMDFPFFNKIITCKKLSELGCENQGAPAIIGLKNPSNPSQAFIPILMGWSETSADVISATQNEKAYQTVNSNEERVFHPIFIKAVGG